MTFYQELQLNQAGSKNLIRQAVSTKEKIRHTAIYLLKILLNVSFCMAFVIAYTKIFGEENSVVGVVILLCVLAFRFADLGIQTTDAMCIFPVIFAILAIGPRLANAGGLVQEFVVNSVCILTLLVLGCHNVVMFNHSTLVLDYLLLYGYDVTGRAYLYRLAGIAFGALLTMTVYYHNHRRQEYKRDFRQLLREFNLHSSRTKWQVRMALGVSIAIFLTGMLHCPRRMWAGIACMSVMLPFQKEVSERVKGRIPGNIIGGAVFLAIYFLLPESMHSLIGVISGIGVGFSATYGWQAVFNSLGALAIATSILGLPKAIFFRVFHNVFGAVCGWVTEHICSRAENGKLAGDMT
ncbi:MAG: FUSC family protein [Lachnospiraceae bacterium]